MIIGTEGMAVGLKEGCDQKETIQVYCISLTYILKMEDFEHD